MCDVVDSVSFLICCFYVVYCIVCGTGLCVSIIKFDDDDDMKIRIFVELAIFDKKLLNNFHKDAK